MDTAGAQGLEGSGQASRGILGLAAVRGLLPSGERLPRGRHLGFWDRDTGKAVGERQ